MKTSVLRDFFSPSAIAQAKEKKEIVYPPFKSDKLSKLCRFLALFSRSGKYTAVLIALSAVFIFTNHCVIGVYVLAIIASFYLLVSSDLMPSAEALITICCFAIKLKESTPVFLKIWPLGIPTVIFFFLHFLIYPPKLRAHPTSLGMLVTSLAIVIGGAGVIYPRTYFSPTSLFYMAMLGFFMLLISLYLAENLRENGEYSITERFSRIMIVPIYVITLCLVFEYFTRRAEFLAEMSVIPFQWRNNASTILMLSMPFAFGRSVKKFGYFFLGIYTYIAILFTGSRGGLIFGAAELALCLLTMLIIDRKHRKIIIAVIILMLAGVAVAGKFLLETLSYTISRLLDPDENTIRIELYKRGINDFLSSPVVGRGLAYMGNRDVHHSAKHVLCWYHNSIIQVAASMGIIGICAYTFLNIQRVKTFVKNISLFSVSAFLSFIGLEMMSLVNPGIFAPVPYLLYVTIYFILMNNASTGGKDEIRELMKKPEKKQ